MLSLKSTFNRNRQKKNNVWQLELSRFTQIELSPFYFSVINFILEYYTRRTFTKYSKLKK